MKRLIALALIVLVISIFAIPQVAGKPSHFEGDLASTVVGISYDELDIAESSNPSLIKGYDVYTVYQWEIQKVVEAGGDDSAYYSAYVVNIDSDSVILWATHMMSIGAGRNTDYVWSAGEGSLEVYPTIGPDRIEFLYQRLYLKGQTDNGGYVATQRESWAGLSNINWSLGDGAYLVPRIRAIGQYAPLGTQVSSRSTIVVAIASKSLQTEKRLPRTPEDLKVGAE